MKHLAIALLSASLCMACQSKDKSDDGKGKAAKPANTAKPTTPTNPATATNPATKPSASPGPNQWWCYKMDELGECHTSLAMCQAKRRAEAKILVKRGLNPIALTACKPQPEVYCFSFNKPEYKAPKAKCNRDAASCKTLYDIFKKRWPDLAMTECEKGGGWQQGPGTKPAAPAK